jgi:tetratricopeptide (TPR) repeat protein
VNRLIAILILFAVPAAVSLAQPDDAASRDIEWQLRNLGSDSAVLRDLAFEKLARYGALAREALVRALASPQREVVARARELLARIPFATVNDPPEVIEALGHYGDMNGTERRDVGYRLAALPIAKSAPALLRLIAFEPSEVVAWYHVTRLKPWIAQCRDQILAARLPARPATLRLLAAAQPERAIELIERAWDAARERSRSDADDEAGLLRMLIARELTALYRAQKRFAEMERCWRQQAEEARDAEAALEVMWLLLERGRASDVEAEWRRYGKLLEGDARAVYLAARAAGALGEAARQNDLLATARSLHPDDADRHFRMGRFLMRRGLLDWAAEEFGHVVRLAPFSVDARYQLALVHGYRHETEKEAAELETALHLKEAQLQRDGSSEEAADLVRDLKSRLALVEAGRHEKAGNPHAQEKALRQALTFSPHHPDALIALVGLVRKRGKPDEAAALVETARAHFLAEIKKQADAAEHYNNLAWLLANTDMHLEEARQLSQKSLELAPDTAAYLDTLAEVCLRLGEPARAVEFQKQAVELEPQSLDLVERLKRFEEAAAKGK